MSEAAVVRPVLSLVLPVFNEEPVLPELHRRLQDFLRTLGLPAEVIFIDDGSRDRSLPMLQQLVQQDGRYRLLALSRNFGQQAATTAGLDHAEGEAVVVMDADLQDPPEVVLQMVAKWREGFEVVRGRRRRRARETWFKLLCSKLFYRFFRALVPIEVPLDTGDFRLLDRRVVIALRSLRESHRFVRGMVSWLGFRQTEVVYDRHGRHAGETKYPSIKLLGLALDAVSSFSIVPLRLATLLGLFVSLCSILLAIRSLLAHFVWHTTVPGWTTTVVVMAMLASVQLVMIGVLGEYVGRIYEQVKGRPLYVLRLDSRAVDGHGVHAAPSDEGA